MSIKLASGSPRRSQLLKEAGFEFEILKIDVDESFPQSMPCLLYTSDAADERSSVDLGGRRIIKKKKKRESSWKRVN